jgi:exonuclease SbcC
MRLHRVKLVNFRQHVDSEITLGPGITAVIGPNGAGKTTLLEAIAWAMYGLKAARGSRDFMRYNRAAPRAPVRVEVDFGLGAHEYRVVRGLYQAELYQDGGNRPVANSQEEVTRKVERLLGMNQQEFFNTYFTSQKELAVMAGAGPADRSRFLSRVLGYEKLQRAQAAVREHRGRLRGEELGLEQGLADEVTLQAERRTAGDRLDQARRRLRAAEKVKQDAERRLAQEGPVWSRMAQLRESVMSLDGERRVAEQRVEEARREFDRLDRELAGALDAQKRLRRLDPRIKRAGELREELARLDGDAQAAGRRRDLSGQLREVTSQFEHVAQRLKEFADAAEQLARAETELSAAHAELERAQEAEEKARTAWVRDKQDAETKRLTLLDQHRELKAHREGILRAGPNGTCPTCLRPLGGEYEAVLGTLARQLEEIEINGRYFRQRLEQLAVAPDALREG